MTNYFKIALTGIIASFSLQVWAQTDTIRTDDIEIVKEYTPFLEQGKKQSFRPGPQSLDPQPPKRLSYNLPSEFVETQFSPAELKPLPLNYRRQIEGRNAYVKAGYGSLSAPLVQLALAKAEQDNFSIGLLGDYYSGKGELFDDQQLADINLTAFGTKELEGASFDASVHYKNNTDYQYGYDHNLINLNDGSVKQMFSNIGGSVGLTNSNDDNVGLNYILGIDFALVNDELYNLQESQTDLRAGIEKRFLNDSKIKLDLFANLRSTDGLTNTDDGGQVLTAIPVFVPVLDDWKLELGASFNYDEVNELKIFPNASLEKQLADERFTVFAGWKGRTKPFGIKQASSINPYINSGVDLQNYTEEQRTPLGIKGRLSPSLAFNASISQTVTENRSLFVNNPGDALINPYGGLERTFDVVRDPKLVSWNLNGQLNYLFSDKANVLLSTVINNYTTDSLAEAWHLPGLEFKADFNVSPIDRFEINGGVNTLTGIKALNNDLTVNKLDAIFVVDLGAKYQATENIGVFIDANNLAGQEYERWKNYESFGLNILGGFVLSY